MKRSRPMPSRRGKPFSTPQAVLLARGQATSLDRIAAAAGVTTWGDLLASKTEQI